MANKKLLAIFFYLFSDNLRFISDKVLAFLYEVKYNESYLMKGEIK